MNFYIDQLPDWAKVGIPKFAGFITGLLVSWLSTRGIKVTPENHEFIALVLVAVFTSVGGAVKWWVGNHLNPANVSSPAMAGQVHADMKAEQAIAKDNGSN